jgi:hypothetical protein
MKRLLLIGVAIVPLLFGCSSRDDFLVLDNSKRKPTTEIELYTAPGKPDKPFKEIAVFNFEGESKDSLKATKIFISRAKAVGANAIIQEAPEVHREFHQFGAISGTTEHYLYKATAIVYQ